MDDQSSILEVLDDICEGDTMPVERVEPINQAMDLNHELLNRVKMFMLALRSSQYSSIEKLKEFQGSFMKCDNSKSALSKKPISLFSKPYFRDTKGRFCPENDDVIERRKQNVIVNAYLLPSRPWNKTETKALTKAVIETIRQERENQLNSRETYLNAKLSRLQKKKHPVVETKAKLKTIATDKQRLMSMTKKKLISETDKIDWLTVSRKLGLRDANECMVMWENCVKPSIYSGPFTALEDKRLTELAKKYNYQDWDLIAQELGTNRSEILVFERYQSELNPNIIKRTWTREEDEKLRGEIEKCRSGEYVPWQQIANNMEGRTRCQVQSRWATMLKPESTTRPWVTEENAVLHAAVLKYPRAWMKVAKFLPHRTNYTCRVHYLKSLMPNISSGGWRLDEDRLLVQKMADLGKCKWGKIAKFLPGRTPFMCLARIKLFKKVNVKRFMTCLRDCKEGQPPDMFMPKQLAPSKTNVMQNERYRKILNDATCTFVAAAKQVLDVTLSDNYEMLREQVQDLTDDELKRISETLLATVNYQGPLPGVAKYTPRRRNRSRSVERVRPNTDDEEEAEEDTNEEDEEELEEEEGKKAVAQFENDVNNQLDSLMNARAFLGFLKYKRSCVDIGNRRQLGYASLLNHLLPAMGAKTVIKTKASKEAREVEKAYKTIWESFVFHSNGNELFPVMPPNECSMVQAMILYVTRGVSMDAMEQDLEKTVQWNLRTISKEKNRNNIICYYCHRNENLETHCNCEALRLAFDRYLLLRKRFTALNLWPMLLNKIPPTVTQFENMIFANIQDKLPKTPPVSKQKGFPKGKKTSSASNSEELTTIL